MYVTTKNVFELIKLKIDSNIKTYNDVTNFSVTVLNVLSYSL